MQQQLDLTTQPGTQKERILRALERAGADGVTNYTLNSICFRYGARLHDLKRDGYKIRSVHAKGSLWRFYLEAV